MLLRGKEKGILSFELQILKLTVSFFYNVNSKFNFLIPI